MRAAPGPQLSTGRLRVDAARAIAKLREYQLVDRIAWVLEAIRAAVASGATAVHLDGDANDVWLRWHGEPWPAEALPRLFDELVSPEPGRDSQHLRLLAAAVNSALGLRPAYVDVWTIAAGGAAHRVRFTPDVLETDGELGDAPLRELEAEAAPAPRGAPAPGIVVHLRRRVSLETLGLLFHRGPPELAAARRACADLAIPLHIGDEVLGRATGRDVLRVPLDHDLTGWLAITDPEDGAPAGAILEIAEHGVVLARYAIELGVASGAVAVPIRLFVDAPRMPTNASRSEVRRTGHPIAAAEARARELASTLVARLTEELRARPDDARARAAALAVIGAAVHGPDWRWNLIGLSGPLAALAALPLVRDAVGKPRPAAGPWRPIGVHLGDEPFAEELEEWLGGVLWAPPGDPAARLFAGASIDRRALRRHARFARRQLRAQRRFTRHAKLPARLATTSAAETLRIGASVAGSCVPDAVVADVDGEVGVFVHDGRRGELALLLDGRRIEVLGYTSPVAFTAIADSPRLIPDAGYRGVTRDAELARVEAAVHGAVIRAVEALAQRANGDEAELATIRRATAMAIELGFPIGASDSPLLRCPAWRTATGERIALAALRGQLAIGAIAPGSGVLPPAGRVVLALDPVERDLISKLLDRPVIDYDRRGAPRSLDRAMELGMALSRGDRCALVIREPGIAAAIAPSATPQITLGHAGVALITEPYPYVLAPCAIEIDADAVIPEATWDGVRSDAGLLARDHAPWERALIRAIAEALSGGAAPDLITPQPPRLANASGRALCAALGSHVPGAADLLGEPLVARLRAASIVPVLGSVRPISVDALLLAYPEGAIPCVPPATPPIAGDDFVAMVGGPELAAAVSALAVRPVEDGTAELTRRRDAALRRLRRAALLANPKQLLALPADTPAQIEAAGGLVGVGAGELVIVLRVEGRPFHRVTRADDLPVVAAIEVEEAAVDAAFVAVREPLVDDIVVKVRAAAAVLLRRIAQTQPEALVDDPRILALLSRWLVKHGGDWETIQALREAPAWPTVQGGRSSLDAAGTVEILRVARWDDDWLAPLDGEPADPLDIPILRVGDHPDDPVRDAITRLQPSSFEDVTDVVRGLQAQRQMTRGLLPQPKIPRANPALRRPLSALGAAGRALGAGELALSLESHSTVHLHALGAPRSALQLDRIEPAIELAIERPDLVTEMTVLGGLATETQEQLARLVQPAATALAQEIAREHPGDLFAPTIRRSLRGAVFAQRLAPEDVADVLVVESTDGRWWPWSMIAEQKSRFGDVWWAGPDDDRVPLTEGRIVLRLSFREAQRAELLGLGLADARTELTLDVETRKNLARPPATQLDLTWDERQQALAAVPLVGDGATAVRGVVAPLSPLHAGTRRVRPHRAMHPFDHVDDPCAWPTVAVIDDARMSADRTWSVPVGDAAWQEVARAIREASEHALRALVPVADRALATRWIGPELYGGISPYPASPQLQVRGALWLIEPTDPGVIVVHRPDGLRNVDIGGAPVAGRLFVHTTARDASEEIVKTLIRRIYAVLLDDAQEHLEASPAVVTAHLARGIAASVIRAEEVREARFACFRPHAFDADQLAAMLHGLAHVDVLAPGDDGTGVVDDGTALSRIVIAALGVRAIRKSPRIPLPPLEAPPLPPRSARPRHGLADLADALSGKLHDVGVTAAVLIETDRRSPLCRSSNLGLQLAAEHPLLSAIDARRGRGGPDATIVLEALCAHALTVLNRDLTEVNDVTEAFALAHLLG